MTRFDSAGGFRGYKRFLHEGGIRIPFVANWPGTISPHTSDHIGYFPDLLVTLCELADVPSLPTTVFRLSRCCVVCPYRHTNTSSAWQVIATRMTTCGISILTGLSDWWELPGLSTVTMNLPPYRGGRQSGSPTQMRVSYRLINRDLVVSRRPPIP